MRKIDIDAREMEHPIPLQIALNHLQSMKGDDYLYMLHRKRPIPLIEVAKEKSFAHLIHQDNSETWHILICKDIEVDLEGLLDV